MLRESRFQEGTTMNYIEYKNYCIEYDIYGRKEYTIQFCGDDLVFATEEEAKAFIDEIENA